MTISYEDSVAARVRRALYGLQADSLSELPLDELIRRIGRAREEKTWRTSRKRDPAMFPSEQVEEGRAAFCVEAAAIIGALDAGLMRVEEEWTPSHICSRALRATLGAGDGAVKVLGNESLYLATLGTSGWWWGIVAAPGTAVRWVAERAAAAGPTLRATHAARRALHVLLTPQEIRNGFDEGWRLEAFLFRGAVEQLLETERRPELNRRRVRVAFRHAYEQAGILLDQTHLSGGPTLSDNIYSLELVAWIRVTAILEEAAERPDRPDLDRLVADLGARIGVSTPNLLTQARITERVLQGGTSEALAANIHQRSGRAVGTLPRSATERVTGRRTHATRESPRSWA